MSTVVLSRFSAHPEEKVINFKTKKARIVKCLLLNFII